MLSEAMNLKAGIPTKMSKKLTTVSKTETTPKMVYSDKRRIEEYLKF